MERELMNEEKKYGLNTRGVATYLDEKKINRPLNIPIVQSSTFQVDTSMAMGKLYRGRADTLYSRIGNPTVSEASKKIALLEDAGAALVFGSGMGAITTALLSVLKPGDHVVAQRDIFAQTYQFLERFMPRMDIETTFVDATDLHDLMNAIRPSTALIYVETPSNPLLKVVDIGGAAEIMKNKKVPHLFVDSTFASPILQNPLEQGATLALHSATKFLSGHGDLTCGAAAGHRELIAEIHEMQIMLGTVMDPHPAWLLLRGLKTLGVRMNRQCESALKIARFLEKSDKVETVYYPWLGGSPYYALARRQMRGGGGVLSFEVSGGAAAARAFLDALRLIPIATSLGGVESVIEIPADLGYGDEETDTKPAQKSVSPALIRLSVGLEDVEDLLRDIENALRSI